MLDWLGPATATARLRLKKKPAKTNIAVAAK